jgi:hypothetical protein
MMNDVFRPYINRFVLVYLNDVLVYSNNSQEHLRAALTLSRSHKLFIKRSKCAFALKSINFLGHVISDKGISMDPSKIQAVLEWPEPSGTAAQCKTQLKGFLGLANFHRRMIDHFAEPAALLNSLTAEKAEWEWTDAHCTSFTELKHRMIKEPIFVHAPHPSLSFFVETNASCIATGAVIYQCPTEEQKQIIAYSSHKLQPAECCTLLMKERCWPS